MLKVMRLTVPSFKQGHVACEIRMELIRRYRRPFEVSGNFSVEIQVTVGFDLDTQTITSVKPEF